MSFADSVREPLQQAPITGGGKGLTLVIGTGPETNVEGQKF